MLDIEPGHLVDRGNGFFQHLFKLGGAADLIQMDDSHGLGVSEHGPILFGRGVVQLFEAMVFREVFDLSGDDAHQPGNGPAGMPVMSKQIIFETMSDPAAGFLVPVDQDGDALDSLNTLHLSSLVEP